MNTIEAICSRKTIRSFTGENITEEELKLILKAANASPVGLGRFEGMHLTVITNKALLDKIDKNCAKMFDKPDIHPLYGAPTLIIVSSEKPNNEMLNVAFSNAAMMVHNMALAATELNVGACYIWGAIGALANNAEILNELNLPKGFMPCSAIALGKSECKYELRNIAENKIAKNFIK